MTLYLSGPEVDGFLDILQSYSHFSVTMPGANQCGRVLKPVPVATG